MAKTSKKPLKRSNTKAKPAKASARKNQRSASFAATLEKELLKTLSKLHDNANKKLTALTREVKKLKAKLIKTVAQKRAPLKKQLEKLQQELHSVTTTHLKATALKKHLHKFEKDWIKKQPKKPKAAKSTAKTRKTPSTTKPRKKQKEEQALVALQSPSNVIPVSTLPSANSDGHNGSLS